MAFTLEEKSLKNLSFIQFVNIFSVFVVLGAVSTAYFFVHYFHAEMPISFYWVLGSGVWVIYTADHLYDGHRLGQEAVFLRHVVHHHYKQILIPTVSAVVAFNAVVVWAFFTTKMILAGCILAICVGMYFILIHFFKASLSFWLKETFIAVVVAAAIVVYPGLVGDMGFNIGDVLIVIIFSLINFANLVLFSYFDLEGDKANAQQSVAIKLGKSRSRQLIYELLATTFVMLTYFVILVIDLQKAGIAISVLAMLNILLVIVLYEERSRKNGLYRFWGDFIYLLPGLVYLLLR